MNGLIQDLRYAMRQMRKGPRFAIGIVLILGLMVGATSAVFSVIYAELIRPLPYDQPEKIFYLESYAAEGYEQPASYPEYRDWQRENHVFSALAGYSTASSNFEGPTGPIAVPTIAATDDFFKVLGVNPVMGRTFAKGEDRAGGENVVVLSYEIWQQNFGAQRGAIGQQVKIDGALCTVIGVMPAGFRFPIASHGAIYVPLHPPKSLVEQRGNHWLETIARVKSGSSAQQAEADMNQVLTQLASAYPETKGRRTKLIGVGALFVGDTAPALKVLILAVMALLGIGCVNITGLLLARGVKREREVAVRSAIGATHGRLARQMLTESLLFAVIGAGLGILLAHGLLSAIRSALIAALARGADVHLNNQVLAAAVIVACMTSLLAGLLPALRLSRLAPYLALKSGVCAGATRGQQHLRSSFIAMQVALALALLVTSGLLLKELGGLRSTDIGFNPDHLLATKINISPSTYQGRDVVTNFYDPLMEQVRAIPGVKSAGLIQALPLQNPGINSEIHIAGQPPAPPNEVTLAEVRLVSPAYFQTLGLPLLRGRMLNEKLDTPSSSAVAVINEAFVRRFFASHEDPIGKHIEGAGLNPTIVGVVNSVRQNLYDPPMPEMDFLISQIPEEVRTDWASNMWLLLRTDVEPTSIIPSLRNVFHDLDPGLPLRQPETMQQLFADTLVFQRLQNWLFGTFAFLAVLLALAGLYGLTSHEVELSAKDIGIRLALGASRLRVLMRVYRRVGAMLLIGVTAGLLISAAAEKMLKSLLVIQTTGYVALIAMLVAGLSLVALLACSLPARRAAKVDPMVALRYE
ncbi:MAG TPA: ABC transporter permease [Terriglobales bacterium]|nr:ABC transporter permease [Terriglobales bacterium]